MLYDGFLGYILWAGSSFGPKFNPVLTILIVSIIVAAIYRGVEWLLTRAMNKLSAQRGDPSNAPVSPRVQEILDEIDKSGGYFAKVALSLLSVPLLIGAAALTPALPLLALGGQGLIQAGRDVARYESRLRQLRDGLADVSVVSVKQVEGGELIRAIPIECAGDRCAAMTSGGPISLPKDRFGEESIARADLTEACFTKAGLAKRREREGSGDPER